MKKSLKVNLTNMKELLHRKGICAGFLCMGVCLTALGGCGARQPRQVQNTDTAMGTVIQQSLYVLGEGDCSGEILELLREMEREELSWRLETSEVYRINQEAGKDGGIALSEEMAGILGQCMELSDRSGGAFDVTLGPVVRLWDIDSYAAGTATEEFQVPGERELEAALAGCGSQRLRIDGAGEQADPGGRQTRLYMPAGMELDLGAVGKGLALARIRDYLEGQPEVTGAVISVGGSILTYGEKPDGSSWKVGIVDPGNTASNIGILSLEGEWCVSTSGDYERYVEVDGVRYHHILDPGTGYPADSGVRGVTVLAEDGLLSDGLSTVCFILGPEAGMELAGIYGAEVLFVLGDGEICMSPGMENYFQRTSYFSEK